MKILRGCVIIISISFVVLSVGCDLFSRSSTGGLELTIESELDAVTYTISGVGPDDETFIKENFSDNSFSIDSLVVGDWVIIVDGYDESDNRIGTNQIEVEIQGKNRITSATITLLPISVTGVSLDQTSITLHIDDTEQLNVSISPADATNQEVSWSSSDKSIAIVSDAGLVTAIAEGSATITVTTADGDYSAECEVEVVIPVSGISLDKTTMTLEGTESKQLTTTVEPENATNRNVIWSSSDKSIVTVSDTGLVSGVGGGSATITVTTDDGSFTDTCAVTVFIPVTGVSLDTTSVTLQIGETEQLTSTVEPVDATHQEVIWSSSDESIATVTPAGVVTAEGSGTATITVTTDDGDHADVCVVTVPVPVSGVTLDQTSLILEKTESKQLTATVEPENATNQEVSWSSSDESVATVSNTGLVHAVSAGNVVISVQTNDGNKTAECDVTVLTEAIPVTEITLDKSEVSLDVGESTTLQVSYLPEDATETSFSWSSSDNSVASVSESGEVIALKEGSAVITVRSNDEEKSDSCLVTISSVPVSDVSIEESSITLLIGQERQLTAVIQPNTATNKKLSWSSSNNLVASVDTQGKVVAVSEGLVLITVYTDDGNYDAYCLVTVNPVPVEEVTLKKDTMSLQEGETAQLHKTIFPHNATNKGVFWSSSNNDVATVSATGLVQAIQVGNATITVTTNDGGKNALCEVTVGPVPVTGVSLNKNSVSLLVGSTEQLHATVEPNNATDKTISWSSSDESIASVTETGEISANSVGTAIIVATTNDGNKKVSCTVSTYSINVVGITLDQLSMIIKESGSKQLTATVEPNDATNQEVSWSSSDSGVANVSTDGLVTGVSVGEAVITATTDDGEFSASCNVTVNPIDVTGVTLDHEGITLQGTESKQLTVTVEPENATNRNVTWSSSDESIATVSDTGLVSGVGVGSSIITVRTEDGNYTATCYVTVVNPVTGVRLNNSLLNLLVGGTRRLTATVEPDDATNQEINWTSSDESVATVSDFGLVTGIGVGSSIITVRTDEGNFYETCTVNVNPVIVIGVNLDQVSMTLEGTETRQLTATVEPDDATNQEINWTSSDESVATVSDFGLVTGIGVGSSIITVRTEDGSYTATCTVTVNPVSVTGVSLNKQSLTIHSGQSDQLVATITPKNTSNKNIFWTSSNESIATVSAEGEVFANELGKTTITVTTDDGEFTDESEIIVTFPVSFAGGDGTINNPYQVETAGHLYIVRNYLNKHFIQTADIDLSYFSDGEGWEPIGEVNFGFENEERNPFLGRFDGNGFTIRNLKINRFYRDYIGLFGYVAGNATITNVTLEDIDIAGRNLVGGLIGHNISSKNISHCSVSGSIYGYGSSVGGLIGYNQNSSIWQCYSSVVVSGESTTGGLIGFNEDGNIYTSYATGDVTGSTTGGLVGSNRGGSITSSYSTGDVTGGNNTGGLIGFNNRGAINRSYALGAVVGNEYTGGLIGGIIYSSISNSYARGDVEGTERVGGLVGLFGWGSGRSIEYSFSTGVVTGNADLGGLTGLMEDGTVINSFYDTETSGRSDTGKGIPKTTSKMMQQATFEDWDFNTIWAIDEGTSYPYLRWEIE